MLDAQGEDYATDYKTMMEEMVVLVAEQNFLVDSAVKEVVGKMRNWYYVGGSGVLVRFEVVESSARLGVGPGLDHSLTRCLERQLVTVNH